MKPQQSQPQLLDVQNDNSCHHILQQAWGILCSCGCSRQQPSTAIGMFLTTKTNLKIVILCSKLSVKLIFSSQLPAY